MSSAQTMPPVPSSTHGLETLCLPGDVSTMRAIFAGALTDPFPLELDPNTGRIWLTPS